VNRPYSSTAQAAGLSRRIAGHSPSAAANAPGVVLREITAAVGAALGVAAAANLLLLWLGIAPTPGCQKGVWSARAEGSSVGLPCGARPTGSTVTAAAMRRHD